MNGGPKIPSVLVKPPKGVAFERQAAGEDEEEDDVHHREVLQKAVRRGQKRLQYLEEASASSGDPDEEDVGNYDIEEEGSI